MKKLLPVIIAVVGLIGGIVGGTVMKPVEAAPILDEHGNPVEIHAADMDDHAEHKEDGYGDKSKSKNDYIYVGLQKPFFAPITKGDGSGVLVRIDLHLEIPESLKEDAIRHEPKLRDSFLKTVLSFSEHGGFSRLNEGSGFSTLRDDLLVSARKVLGSKVKNVLIGEILTRDS